MAIATYVQRSAVAQQY